MRGARAHTPKSISITVSVERVALNRPPQSLSCRATTGASAPPTIAFGCTCKQQPMCSRLLSPRARAAARQPNWAKAPQKGAQRAQQHARAALDARRGGRARFVPQLAHLQRIARSRNVSWQRGSASVESSPALAHQHARRGSESMRAWRVSRRGGSRAHAHQSCSLSAPSERPCSPLQVQDMHAESARASTRRTNSKGDDRDQRSSQPMHVGCYTCCRHAARLWHASGAIPELPDLGPASSLNTNQHKHTTNRHVSVQRPLLLCATPPPPKRLADAQIPSTASYLHLGTNSTHATRPSNRYLKKKRRVSEWYSDTGGATGLGG